MADNFLIDQWYFDDGESQQIKHENMHELKIQSGNWYHCHREAASLRKWLQFNQIEPSIIHSLLRDDTRPRFERYDDGSFLLILRGVNLNEGAKPDDMLSIRMFWKGNALISTNKMSSRTINSIRSALLKKEGPKQLPDLLMGIIAGLNLNIEKFLNQMEAQLFELDDTDYDGSELQVIHKRILKLKRFLKPQQYAINDLVEADIPEISSVESHSWNVLDTSTRVTESMDFYLEQIQVMKSELEQEQAEKMNRNTYLFTIVAAIFLPLGFLTGLLGINIGGMPGVDSPTAFGLFCIGLVITLVIELCLLKWLKFF